MQDHKTYPQTGNKKDGSLITYKLIPMQDHQTYLETMNPPNPIQWNTLSYTI